MIRTGPILVALLLVGCATYSDDFRPIHRTAVGGDMGAAESMLDERLGSAGAPADMSEEAVLWLLERGALRQGLGEYRASAADLVLADQNLEVLDVTREKSVDIARYLYSDSAVAYRAPPHERILLNALNLVNYLALGDVEGARVEARRFQVFERYLEDSDDREALPATLGLGNYLSGLAFELSGDLQSAARHYSRAYRFGFRGDDLEARLVAILRATGTNIEGGGGLDRIAAAAREAGPISSEDYARDFVDGQLVAIVQTGWTPYRAAERVSLADAVLWIGVASSPESAKLGKLLAEGVVKWINFPVLVSADLPPPVAPAVLVDGARAGDPVGASVARAAVAEYERAKGYMMLAAITRLLTRIAAGEVTEAAIEKATEKKGKKRDSGELIGWLANMVVQGTLSALDRPDTRNWTLLPAEVRVYRTRLEPGEHRVTVSVRGGREERTLTMTPHGAAVVNFSRLR